MTDETPIWRQAIHDQEHPLHKAAWAFFSESFGVKYADRVLLDQRDEVIEFAFTILDTPELYDESALGSGHAPIHAIELLGHWKVTEALPRLFKILEEEEWETVVHDKAILALEEIGESIVEDVMAFGDRMADEDQKRTASSILSKIGRGNQRAYNWMLDVFNRQTDEYDILFMAENLLYCDRESAIPLLEERIRNRIYSKAVRARLQKYIDDFRSGEWDDL